MSTFFGILFIIIGANAVIMVFSLSGSNQKAKKPSVNQTGVSSAKIYPLDLVSSKYKKAI